jgi:hypothetical protein
MLPVITKKYFGQHVANCCLGVRPPLYRVNVEANPQVVHVQSTDLGMLDPTTAEPPSQNAAVPRPAERISNLLPLQEEFLPAIPQGGGQKINESIVIQPVQKKTRTD